MADNIEDAGVIEREGLKKMVITRGADAVPHVPHNQRGSDEPGFELHPAIIRGLSQMHESADAGGAAALVLFSSPKMHVSYAWFKSGYPLPLHSHDANCYYLVIGGSMRVGTETLAKGDGAFIPGGVPYTVNPGEDGVEFLEIRDNEDYDTHYRAKTDAYWDKMNETRLARKAIWASEKAPYGLVPAEPEDLARKYREMMK